VEDKSELGKKQINFLLVAMNAVFLYYFYRQSQAKPIS
jgi:hypothetical protein